MSWYPCALRHASSASEYRASPLLSIAWETAAPGPDVYVVFARGTFEAPGVGDAADKIESMVASCPGTRKVLGGYSQGAAVAA